MTTSLTPQTRYVCGNVQSAQTRYSCGDTQGLTTRFTCGDTRGILDRYVFAIDWTLDMTVFTLDETIHTDIVGRTRGWTLDGLLYTSVLP